MTYHDFLRDEDNHFSSKMYYSMDYKQEQYLRERDQRLISFIRETCVPKEIGYKYHMSNKTAYDQGNGWNYCRTYMLQKLDTLQGKE